MIDNSPLFIVQLTQKFKYDFAIDGGAIGNIALRGGSIPNKAIIVSAVQNVITVIDGNAGATSGISIESLDDLLADTAVNPASGVGAYPVGAINAIATSMYAAGNARTIVTTAARVPTMVVTTATLTQGKFDLFITYVIGS